VTFGFVDGRRRSRNPLAKAVFSPYGRARDSARDGGGARSATRELCRALDAPRRRWLPSLGNSLWELVPPGREPPSRLAPAIRVTVEKGVEKLSRLALVSGHQVAIAIEGDGDRAVSHVAGERLGVDAGGDHE
jgi:hypothetical protein